MLQSMLFIKIGSDLQVPASPSALQFGRANSKSPEMGILIAK